MPGMLEHVAYMSQDIGPRPAGTEEEQQTALWIQERLQEDAGFSADVEDFAVTADAELIQAVCSGVALIFAIFALFVPVMGIPAIILAVLAAVITAAELFDKPIISRYVRIGVSQNVVAKYLPGQPKDGSAARQRKVVLVAHYDSGRVRQELGGSFVTRLPRILWIGFIALCALAVLVIIHTVFFYDADGIAAGIVVFLIGVCCIGCLIPIVFAVLHHTTPYNEAANCNAAGIAVLLDVAKRVGRGRVGSSADADAGNTQAAVIHGESLARQAGLIPDDAQVVYEEAPEPPEIGDQSPAARLAAAKAAIAALTGNTLESKSSSDIASNLVQVGQGFSAATAPSSRITPRAASVSAPSTDDTFDSQDRFSVSMRDVSDPNNEVAKNYDTHDVQSFEAGPADSLQDALPYTTEEDIQTDYGQEAPAQMAFESVDLDKDGQTSSDEAQKPQAAFDDQPKSTTPAWFTRAQQKAHKPDSAADTAPIARSQYAEAFEHYIDGLDADISEDTSADAQVLSATQDEDHVSCVAQETQGEPTPAEMEKTWETWGDQDSQDAPNPPDTLFSGEAQETPEVAESVGSWGNNFAKSAGQDDISAKAAESGEALRPDLFDFEGLKNVTPKEVAEPDFVARKSSLLGIPSIESSQTEEGRKEDALETSSEDILSDGSTSARRLRSADLPSLSGPIATSPGVEQAKQRAPLDDAQTSGKVAAKSLLSMLPSVSGGMDATQTDSFSEDVSKDGLRASLPSLSGGIAPSGTGDTSSQNSIVGAAGSFNAAGMTGAFAPVGDELVEDISPDEVYIEDADDSDYEENFTESGAFAGPGYVEMPTSRVHRLLDKLPFRKKQNTQEASSAQEWLDVDEDFDAREIGKARGGWESFNNESADYERTMAEAEEELGATKAFNPIPDAPDQDSGRRWNGGGFSREHLGHIDQYDDAAQDSPDDISHGSQNDAFENGTGTGLGTEVFARSAESQPREERTALGQNPDAAVPQDVFAADEAAKIQQFRHPDVGIEVWFVGLGAELSGNAGIKVFLEDHASELRGAIIVELEGLGAGQLSLIEEEGVFVKARTSSRMSRYTKKVTQATGTEVSKRSILWGEGAAATAIGRGLQAMHLAGMEGQVPAWRDRKDDTVEQVDEQALSENADFVMELLKII